MSKARFLHDKCKGCGLCVAACPLKLIGLRDELNKSGYRPADSTAPEKCTGCAMCAISCPDVAIMIE